MTRRGPGTQHRTEPASGSKSRRPPERIRLLALDIDDTLTGSDGRVSPANLAAIRQAMARGILVTAVTGRRYRNSAERFADDIGITGPIACHYGRALVEHPAGRFIVQHFVPLEIARRVVEFAALNGLVSSVCADEVFFFDRSKPAASVEGRRLSLIECVDDFEEVFAERGSRIMTMALSGPGAERVREFLAPEIAAGAVAVNAQRMSGQPDWLAVVMAGRSDKGTALLELCGYLGVDPAETVALGDSEADIPMLRAAGYGIAMPWAEPEVRRAADRVADGRREDASGKEIAAILSSRGRG